MVASLAVILLLGLSLSFQVIQIQGDNCSNESSGYYVDYIGQSSQFRYYACSDNTKQMKIKMSSLTEMNSVTGKKTNNKVSSFASTDWSWDNPNGNDVDYQGYSAIQNRFVAQLRNDAYFSLDVILFTEDARILIYDENETISNGTLKFSTNITNWPYLAADNFLELCINLKLSSSEISNSTETNNNISDVISFGEFSIDAPLKAVCNESYYIPVNISSSGNDNNQLNLCFSFEYCGNMAVNELYYDPLIRAVDRSVDRSVDGDDSDSDTNGGGSSGNGSSSGSSSNLNTPAVLGIVVGCIALFIIIVAVIYDCSIRNKNNRVKMDTGHQRLLDNNSIDVNSDL